MSDKNNLKNKPINNTTFDYPFTIEDKKKRKHGFEFPWNIP